MPRKATAPKAAAAGAKKGAKGSYRLADPLPPGEVLSDLTKGQWVTGASIGVGGFGLIYLATPKGNEPADSKSKFVVKVEPKSNGPLFSELSFYQRVAKEAHINNFKSSKKLKSLGMPRFVASGQHIRSAVQYRFMVMDRFSTDLQKCFEQNGKRFPDKTGYTLAIQVLDVLEFIHSQGYVHADIKASNMLLGFDKSQENQAYLVDYGLAAKYIQDSKHKEYKEDPRRCHDGTIEFTSIDAHKGVAPSRRGDFEILGYCLLQWLCGKLPWEDNLDNKEYVRAEKIKCMADIPGLLRKCLLTSHSELQKYLQYVKSMQYEAEPNYDTCKKLFRDAIKRSGGKDDGKLAFTVQKKKPQSKKRKSNSTEEDLSSQDEYVITSPKRIKETAQVKTKAASTSSPAVNKVLSPIAKSRSPAVKKAAKLKVWSPAVENIKSPVSKVKSPAVRASPRSRVQSPKAKQSTSKVKSPTAGAAAKGVSKAKRKKALIPKVNVGVQTSPGLKGLKRSRQEK